MDASITSPAHDATLALPSGTTLLLVLIAVLTLAAIAIAALVWLRARDRIRLAELTAVLGTTQQTLTTERADAAAAIARLDEANDAARAQIERFAAEAATLRERVTNLEAAKSLAIQTLERQIADLHAQTQTTFESSAGKTLKLVSDQFAQRFEQLFDARQKAATTEVEGKARAFETLLKPIAETLAKTDAKLNAIDAARLATAAEMQESMRRVGDASAALHTEAKRLVAALREPNVRGMYGEIQLKKVAELAGMRSYCDFAEQHTTRDDQGKATRPDMIVRLPSGRELAIDAKANLKPYLDALEAATPEARETHLNTFADGIVNQAKALAKKGYWSTYQGSPEFVVMFVPGDQFVDAALSKRPDLLELAAGQRVLLASPSTLIGLLRAVHVGFQEHKLAEDARQLHDLGRQMHERMATALTNIESLGKALNQATNHYNSFVASYESRLLPALRKFEDVGAAGSKPLPDLHKLAARADAPRIEPKPDPKTPLLIDPSTDR